MPLYEYECHNPDCGTSDGRPHEFEAMRKLVERDDIPDCDTCVSPVLVRKVIRSAVPRSMTWRV